MYTELKFKRIFIDSFDVAEKLITSQAHLKKDLGLDSLDVMEVILHIEKAFNIEVSDEDVTNMTTFGDMVTCVQRYGDKAYGRDMTGTNKVN